MLKKLKQIKKKITKNVEIIWQQLKSRIIIA